MNDDVFQKTAGDSVPHQGVLRPRDFSEDFTFVHYPSPDNLATYVEYLWIIRWDFADDLIRQSPAVLPNPQINLFFSAEGAGVQGVFKGNKSYTASYKGCVVGVTFKPGGFFAFWPHDASTLTDKDSIITGIFPEVTSTYVTELLRQNDDDIRARLEDLLGSKQLIADPNIVLVQRILTRLKEDPELQSVEAIAHTFSKSDRALQQLFQTYVGVGIKWVLLRNRLLSAVEVVRSAATPDWTSIALDLGYASQAHFITDFKRVTGMTPGSYLRMQE